MFCKKAYAIAGRRLYVISQWRGLTANTRTTIITATDTDQDHFSPNPARDVIYEGDFELFFEPVSDSLRVYTPLVAAAPHESSLNAIVKQIAIDNTTALDLFTSGKVPSVRKLCD